jgi:hypothetical protein
LLSTHKLICNGFVVDDTEPEWEIVVQGSTRADSVPYRDGVLFVQTASDTPQTVQVERLAE